MNNILIVEDENRLREIMRIYLKANQYNVFEAFDGMQALEIFHAQPIHLIVLDVMLPKMNGFEICETIRKTSDVPIIFLTALEAEEQHIMAYGLGADDYLTKPVNINILLSKIKRMLDKTQPKDILKLDELVIDLSGRNVYIEEQYIAFAPKEFDLLLLLAKNKGKVLSRELLTNQIWGFDFFGETRVVDNHIRKIRKKLGPLGYLIQTVVSIGYKLEVK